MKQIATALFTLFVVTSLVHAEPDVHIGLGVWIWELPRCERGNIGANVWSWQHMAPEHWSALAAFGNRPAGGGRREEGARSRLVRGARDLAV